MVTVPHQDASILVDPSHIGRFRLVRPDGALRVASRQEPTPKSPPLVVESRKSYIILRLGRLEAPLLSMVTELIADDVIIRCSRSTYFWESRHFRCFMRRDHFGEQTWKTRDKGIREVSLTCLRTRTSQGRNELTRGTH